MWRNRGLLTLWGGEFLSRVGESFFQIALLWYLLETTGSALATGLVTMVSFLPAIVVGVWAGVWVDRWDCRRVLVGADLVRVLLVVAIPLLALTAGLPVWGVAALAFLVTSGSAFFNPARDAIIPLLAHAGELVAANSLVQSAWQFSLLVGPFLAAAALPFLPTVYLFFLVGAAFALSLAVLLLLRRDAAVRPMDVRGRPLAFAESFRGGLHYLWRERRVFWLWTITVVNNFFLMGAVIVGMPVYVKQYLGGTGSDFALVEGVYAAGMIVSTWLISRFGHRFDPVRTLFTGLIYDGLTYIPLLFVTSVPGTIAVIVVHALGIPTITISRLTALHRLVAHELQGRVFSYFHLAVAGMTALSIGAVGLVLEWLPANWLFAVIGVLCAATGVFGHLLPVFREQPLGAGKAAEAVAQAAGGASGGA